MDRFEKFGLKIGNLNCLNEYTQRFVSKGGHGHCLTFDPGLS